MADTQPTPKLAQIVDHIWTGGKEIERSLQIAAGTVCLTVLGTLPSVWSNILEPMGGLRLAMLDLLRACTGAFLFALLGTAVRIFYSDVPRTRTYQRIMTIVAWGFPIVAAVWLLASAALTLTSNALWETEKELAIHEGTARPSDPPFGRMGAKLRDLWQSRDAAIADQSQPNGEP